MKELQKGINYPDDLESLSIKHEIKKNTLLVLFSRLKDLGLLVEEKAKISLLQESLYDRQIRFFRSFENQNRSGEELNQNLQHRTVLIVGLGGYGSWTALLCARMGIKTIIGIDFDYVDITNLHRQILYTRKDLGKPKIEVCKEKIQECDTSVNFIGHCLKIKQPKDLHVIVKETDFIFNPFSYLPQAKARTHPAQIVAQAALDIHKPCLTFGGSWVGPLTIPGETPCYFCAIERLSNHCGLDPSQRNPYIQKRAFAPPIATCCSLAVFEASRFLSGCDSPQTMQGIMQLDILSFANNRFFTLNRNNVCGFCSSYSIKKTRDE
ncbi:MAG: ThiF family adenylyltransferase [Waddliaceae bacterium]